MHNDSHIPSHLDEALAQTQDRYTRANPRSRAWHDRAVQALPGGHSRQTLYFAPFPLVFTSGHDAHISDLDGHEYLNLVGDYAAGLYGASCEPLRRATLDALQKGISLSGLNTPELELAELICRRIPSIELIRFCNSGSEACLFAAQLARHATGRQKLLVFEGCYHGGFLLFGKSPAPLTVPIPAVIGTYNDVDGTRALLRESASDLAAVMVEPMMGAGGAIPATADFLRMLREETERHGIVLLFDEVMTSRLAPGALQSRFSIRPDLTTLGKFWGGGFSFGAFGGAKHLMRHLNLEDGGTLSQGGTFNNNVFSMTAGLAGARDVYTPTVSFRLNTLGDELRERLNRLGRETAVAFQATGIGGVLNTHWTHTAIRTPADVLPINAPVRRLYHLEMLLNGYWIASRGMITLSLPLTRSDLDGFVAATGSFLQKYRQVLPAIAS